MSMTADRLLEGVKRRVSAPADQVLMEDEDFLAIADDVTKAYLMPILVSLRQDYFVTTSTTSFVADQADYAIPYRAMGRTLRDLKVVDSAGTIKDLSLVPIEDCHRTSQVGTPYGFYFKGDKIVIVPTPTEATSSLQFWYELAPGRLCAVSDAATVTSVASDVVTVSAVPSTMIAAVSVDFVQGTSGCSTLAMDKAISSVAGNDITFATGAVPSGLAAGDYISLAGTSPVIQLPDECYPLLESHVARRVLVAIGDLDTGRLDDDIKEETKNLKTIFEPRIQGENTIVLNRNSLLRGRRMSPRRGLFY